MSKIEEQGRVRNTRLSVCLVIVAMVVCVVFVFYIQSQRPTSEELLVLFESEHFGEKELIEADEIKSGDVLIKLGTSEFLQQSANRTVYKTTSRMAGDWVVYHCFIEGDDGELVEYSFAIFFYDFDGEWREMRR